MTLRDQDSLICGFAETINENAPLLSEIIKLSKVSVLKSETPTPTQEKYSFNNDLVDDISIQSDKSISSTSSNKPVLNVKTPSKDFDLTYTMNNT